MGMLVLCCAVCFALHIVVGRYSPHHHTTWLVAVQIAVVALLAVLPALLLKEVYNNRLVWRFIDPALCRLFPFCAKLYATFASPSIQPLFWLLAALPHFCLLFAGAIEGMLPGEPLL